jgi:cob(I)alamin adenosyltransferase
MVIVFTGNGKGKTTASLGQMVRAVGRGKNALMIQFIKGPWESGEDKFATQFSIFPPEADPAKRDNFSARGGPREAGQFTIRKRGLGFVGILGDKLPREDHAKAAHEALEEFRREKESGKWFLIALDEVNVAVGLGLITAEEVLQAVKDYPDDKLLIMSGRGAPQEFIDCADLATEMREIKHPYNQGKEAKLAIEF